MMARVASTVLLRVIMSKSPKDDPRYIAICSPHQSNSLSKGMIERKHTDPKKSTLISKRTISLDPKDGTHTQRSCCLPSERSGKPRRVEEKPITRSNLGIRSKFLQQPKTVGVDVQELKITALTLSMNPMRLRPYPLKRFQAVVKGSLCLSSTFSKSLCCTCVGKLCLSPLVRARSTRSRARISSSSVPDGFSDGGSVAMSGRGGGRLPQRFQRRWSTPHILNGLMRER